MKNQSNIKPAKAKLTQRIQQHKRDLLIALEATLGIVTPACEKVGLDRATFYAYYNTDTAFRATVDSIRDKAIDFLESKAYQRVKDGSDTMIIFMLKCLGKKRGYIERQEITGAGGKDLIPAKYDLSKLSQTELLALKIMQEKIEIKDTANE